MSVCVAETQGSIGYMIQQSLRSELKRRGSDTVVSTIVTRVIVDAKDAGLNHPKKPIGRFFTKKEADRIRKANPEIQFAEDMARGGWRRVVPSPDPIRIGIAEQESIKLLVDSGFIVIACGGGGIATVEKHGWHGVGIDAVIDKDLAAERLATLLHASKLVILTDVDAVYLDYNSAKRKKLRKLNLENAKRYLSTGQFGEGSMAPKVLAAIRFVENGGEEAIIGELSRMSSAIAGRSGTHITR
jgi:carbamate kinase